MVYVRPALDVEYIKPDLEKHISSEMEKDPASVRSVALTATAAVAAGTWIVACTRAKGAYRSIDWREPTEVPTEVLGKGGD